jgi:hypothetical protein
MSRCPSELTLEAHLLRPEPEVTAHLAGCAACPERLRRMELLGDEFRTRVYPATVGAVRRAARATAPGRSGLFWLVPLPAFAAAALVALLGRAPSPGAEYVGTKGNPLGFTVFAATDGGARSISDREEIPAAAALRFYVKPPRPCWLWVVSVDTDGQVSRIFPAGGSTPTRVEAAGALPGGALLDGRAGPERMYAVCTRQSLVFDDLAHLVEIAATGGEGGVRGAGELQGLPEGAAQATVVLEKRQ